MMFQLTDADRQSLLWKRLSDHMNERLDTLRKSNDNDLDVIGTAKLRGRIEEVKHLLSLGNEPIQIARPVSAGASKIKY